jgi:hypothetical protein
MSQVYAIFSQNWCADGRNVAQLSINDVKLIFISFLLKHFSHFMFFFCSSFFLFILYTTQLYLVELGK